ncbi:MAG: rhamnan synthesis protein F, partial [Deltaproteobacteria bacterium]|nr:rhamnan synthesis protein F [Deltaproteobacteria bacterium]
KNRRCPLFKRKNFYNIYEEFFIGSCGEATAEFYTYLRKETNYDVNLIWDNLLRTVNMADIKERMQLNYILPQRGIAPYQFGEKTQGRIALLLHIYYADQIEWCYRYAAHMPAEADVYVTTDSEEKREKIQARFADL